jgi:hypothetical protein
VKKKTDTTTTRDADSPIRRRNDFHKGLPNIVTLTGQRREWSVLYHDFEVSADLRSYFDSRTSTIAVFPSPNIQSMNVETPTTHHLT